MESDFRSLIRKFCLNTSILGLKYFYLYPDRLSRCFWAIFMCVVFYFSWVFTFLLYERFLQNPTRIAMENQYTPVHQLPYPAITLCSPNQITLSGMQHFNKTLVDGNRSLDLEYILPQLIGFYYVMDLDIPRLEQLQSLIQTNRYTITEVMSSLPQSCERFLKLCYLFKRRYPGCKGLFRPILTTYGLCCIFNSGYYLKHKIRNEWDPTFQYQAVSLTGPVQGLTVVTDYEPDDAIDNTIIFAGAVRVMFTDWREFPADDESVMVRPNTESYLEIRATHTYCSMEVQALSSEGRDCYFEDEVRLPFFKQYHNSDCDILCFANAVEQECRCMLLFLPNIKISLACNVSNIQCIAETRYNMNTWIETAKCDCPRDCDFRRYKLELSLGNLAALPYLLRNPYQGIVFNESTSIQHFYFPTSVYVKQKQETVMSITTLFSNLGGVFGLCLGCSVISVFELMFYLYIGVKSYFHRRLQLRWHRRVGFVE